MDEGLDGAGGVPIRNEKTCGTYIMRPRGNYPLLRSYSGTKNILRFAQVLQDTINNAWCAVPLFGILNWTKGDPRTLRRQ